mmetsp:Transcript_1379/g.3995  ORF Transcript_1379/g.3995 Transcript_1379/m.3995 type:complete len:206 (+) Transcript_1379:2619-3236(+)
MLVAASELLEFHSALQAELLADAHAGAVEAGGIARFVLHVKVEVLQFLDERREGAFGHEGSQRERVHRAWPEGEPKTSIRHVHLRGLIAEEFEPEARVHALLVLSGEPHASLHAQARDADHLQLVGNPLLHGGRRVHEGCQEGARHALDGELRVLRRQLEGPGPRVARTSTHEALRLQGAELSGRQLRRVHRAARVIQQEDEDVG